MMVLPVSISLLIVLLVTPQSNGYSVNSDNSRRHVLQTVVGNTVASFGIVAAGSASPARAVISACPPRSQNCIRTTWTAPDGSPDINKSLFTMLSSYPQEGQNDADLGGWTIASGDLLAGDKQVRYEYSSGVGKFAKFFNGGKPFIDDLDIEIVGNTIEIRSASRVGDSDFEVNKKRLLFLGEKAKALGWNVPEPKY